MARPKGGEHPQRITVLFRKDENYRLIPVNGVWGGVTSRGDIQVDLYHESLMRPSEVTHDLTPQGAIGPETARKPSQPLIERTVLVGMMLTAEQADSIGRWLRDKAVEVAKARIPVQQEGGKNEPESTH